MGSLASKRASSRIKFLKKDQVFNRGGRKRPIPLLKACDYIKVDVNKKEIEILKKKITKLDHQCFKEFEGQTLISYSGTGGTNLPPEVKEEIAKFKGLVYQKSK